MSYESHSRCRFWPDCMIHTGEPRPHYLSEENLAEIRQRAAEGESRRSIAEGMDIGHQAVSNVLTGRTYAGDWKMREENGRLAGRMSSVRRQVRERGRFAGIRERVAERSKQ